MHSGGGQDDGRDPGELMRSFRWTQRLAQRLVGDPGLADDLHQETWTRALERFGGAIPGRAWLAGTVRSMAFRARRGERRRRLHEGQYGSQEGASGDPDDLEALLMRSEAQQRVAAAVGRLPKELQVPLLLHFQEGLALGAIARRLGCPKSTAADRVQRGLVALRRELRSEGGGWQACCALAVPFGVAPLMATVPVASTGAATLPATAGATLGMGALTGFAMKKLVALGALVALAILGVSVLKLSSPVQLPGTDETASSAPDAVPQASGLGNAPLEPLGEAASVSTSAGRTLVPTIDVPQRSRQDGDFTFLALVVGPDGEPLSRPRMTATARGWRKEVEGADDGTVAMAISAEELLEFRGESVRVLVAGGFYQTLWSCYIRADGTGRIAPPSAGLTQDFGTIALERAGAVEGRAMSAAGIPIAGATINVGNYDPEEPDARYGYSGVEPDVVTGEDGRFVMGHLKPRAVTLCVEHALFLRDVPLTPVTIREGQTVGPVFLSAPPAAVVTGRVLDAEGMPMEGVYVNGTENWSRLDTDQTGSDGVYRIGLRNGGPAAVQAYLPGWKQVSPPVDAVRGAGQVDIVMEPRLPEAAFDVAVADAETGDRIREVGIAVLPGEGATGPPATDEAPERVVQPVGGVPMDYVPGVDRLLVTAQGYVSMVHGTGAHGDVAPHLTLKLKRAPGVRGRLLENGVPVVGARVQLMGLFMHLASPREVLRDGRPVRLPTVRGDHFALTQRRGVSPESVLGLDGDPPPHWLVTSSAKHGARTDGEGRFEFQDVELPAARLRVERNGETARVHELFTIENGSLDLGDIEQGPAASITGRLEYGASWYPSDLVVHMRDPKREVPVGEDGSFRLDGLQPGPVYFMLKQAGMEGLPGGFMHFEDVPLFHVNLAPGENRVLHIDLNPYGPVALDLDVILGQRPLAKNYRIEVTPVDEPGRPFRLWCQTEGRSVQATTRALGLCHLAILQSASKGGWLRVPCPGPPLDLRAGQTVEEKVVIPAGRVKFTLEPPHPGARFDSFDLYLEGEGRSLEVLGVDDRSAGGAEEAVRQKELLSCWIPEGSYRATLKPSRNTYKESKDEVLATFDVEIADGATSTVEP